MSKAMKWLTVAAVLLVEWSAQAAVYKNVASQKLAVFAYDTSAGGAKTGDSANITAQISLDGAATAATNDVNPTELDATDAPGIYIFDLTDAETNADMIVVFAVSATSDIEIDPAIIYTTPGSSTALSADTKLIEGGDATDALGTAQTGDSYARLGAPAGASVSADVAAVKSDTAAVLVDTADMQPRVAAIEADTNELQTDDYPASFTSVTGYVDDLESRLGTPSDLGGGATVAFNLSDIEGQTDDIGAAGAGLTEAGGTGDQYTGIASVGAVAGNVGGNVAGSVGSVTAGVTLANDAITAAKFDEVTAFPVTSADTGATQIARVGADADTLETLSDEIAGVTAPTAGAVADAVWTEAIADHSGTAGSTAEQLAAAGAGGDPWATGLPGPYTSGQAGSIIGNFLENFVSLDLTASSITSGSAADLIGRAEQGGGLTVVGSDFDDDDGDDLYFKTSGGVGISGAVVRAILTSSYPAPASLAGVPRTTTGNDGGLSASFYLDSGSYTIEWRHPDYAVHTTTITVP